MVHVFHGLDKPISQKKLTNKPWPPREPRRHVRSRSIDSSAKGVPELVIEIVRKFALTDEEYLVRIEIIANSKIQSFVVKMQLLWEDHEESNGSSIEGGFVVEWSHIS